MPDLPHGWRVRNSAGEKVGPPLEDVVIHSGDEEGDENSEPGSDVIDIRPDSEGWDDVEDDKEDLSIKSLLDDKNFPTASEMIEYCKKTYDFDFLAVVQKHNLDFYSAIKLVNYIRSEVQAGKQKPDVSDPSSWADDKFLQPVLEDDALLFSLDDIIETTIADHEMET